jgi:hypothetical protein
VSDSWYLVNPYWIPIDTNIGLLANNSLRDSPWARGSGMVAQSRAAEGASGLPDGGLFPILSRSRNQDAALSPFQTNGGLFGSLGWAVGDALHGRDLDERWYKVGPPIPPPVFPGPNGRGDANPPHWPQTATPLGVNVGSLARADQPSDQLWESVSIPLAQAQFPFESGSEPVPTARNSVDAAECNAMHDRDLFHCRMVGLSSCYAQANLRLANCLAGKQIPPLSY